MPMLRQLFDTINNTQLYDTVVDPKTKQTKLQPTQPPMAVRKKSKEIERSRRNRKK
jgi:hypothetical protein